MTALLVSENPLLGEVLSAALSKADVSLDGVEPGGADAIIEREPPAVVMLDSSLPAATLMHLLNLSANRHCGRVILVDPHCNKLTLLDLGTQTVVGAADLVEAIRAGSQTQAAV